MRPQKLFLLLLLICSCHVTMAQEKVTAIQAGEMEMLLGEWVGSLRYLDYSSGEPYQMPL